jgi:hypothetical protein
MDPIEVKRRFYDYAAEHLNQVQRLQLGRSHSLQRLLLLADGLLLYLHHAVFGVGLRKLEFRTVRDSTHRQSVFRPRIFYVPI